MKTKMIFSEYNPETKISTVKIANKMGCFTGYAKCHPDDVESNFFGCHIAEYRAYIKAFKNEKQIIEAQIQILNHAYTMFDHNKDYDENNVEARKIRKIIMIKKAEKKEIEQKIDSLKLKIVNLQQNRVKTLNKLNEVKNN